MQVIEFIKEKGFDALTTELGISVKRYPEGLVVLNYNQIESPKTHPIVIECRSLILCEKTLGIVSRSFDRFFNYGEALNVMPEIDWTTASAVEKVDGSLIKVYYHDSEWHIATRGTAFAESECMGFPITFQKLVLKALGFHDMMHFEAACNIHLDPTYTYIGELTCVENRVVKHYSDYTLHFLASRHNRTGRYGESCPVDPGYEGRMAERVGFVPIKKYSLSSAEDALKAARELKNLDEGFIVYQGGVPVCKIKSPAYVAVHHIRGEGLNPKRISQLVISGEEEEYLTYFPEDRPVIEPYIRAYEVLHDSMTDVMELYEGFTDQKEFAKRIGQYPFKAVLFNARAKGISVNDSFHQQRDSNKIELLRKYVV